MRRLRILTIVAAFSAGMTMLSATIPAQTLRGQKPLGEIEQSMESNLNWNLQNALLLYYPENKFVINAKVKLKRAEARPYLPELPDALLSKDLTNLPGLPYLPEELVKPGAEDDGLPPLQQSNRNYEIERIWVNVLVDKSLKQSDWAFIRRFVNLTANLQPERGDQVRLEGLDFPERDDFMPEEKPEVAKAPAAMPAPVPETEKPQESALPPWFPYAFVTVLALLVVALLLFGLKNIARSVKPGATETAAAALPVSSAEKSTQALALSEATATAKTDEDKEKLKTAAIDAIVGTPAASATVFSRWIDEEGEGGFRNTAILLSSISRSMLDLLEPHFGQEIAEKIQREIAHVEPADIELHQESLLRRFDNEVRKFIMLKKYDPQGDVLAFLHQMTDDQLQHLLKPLKHGVVAIVLAQLRTNRAARLLDKMDREQRKAVLASMGNIDRIPADVYQHIARQLAARANELKWMRYVRANGVDTLVKVLDYLDEETQSETIDYLQTQDVKLAQKVNQHFVTFNQFIHMSNDRLREVAVEVDRDTLAKSLVSLDDDTVENIIRSLPEKLGELVRASLESNIDISDDEVTAARRTLMRSVRGKKIKVTTVS